MKAVVPILLALLLLAGPPTGQEPQLEAVATGWNGILTATPVVSHDLVEAVHSISGAGAGT